MREKEKEENRDVPVSRGVEKKKNQAVAGGVAAKKVTGD